MVLKKEVINKFLVFILALMINWQDGFAQDFSVQDSITGLQSNISFNSITDGQPGPPGKPFFSFISAYRDSEFQYQLQAAITFAKKGFFRNTVIAISVPTLDAGNGIISFER